MSEKFVASNGIEIAEQAEFETNLSTWKIGQAVFRHTKSEADALREFFLHERDTELGRWRWPDDPRYLVFPLKDDDEVRVLDENSGQSVAIRRSSFRPGLTHTHFVGAALAYFDTHPEPKPWHDAKPGELWEVSISASGYNLNIPCREPLPMQVMVDDSGSIVSHHFVHWNGPDAETIDIEDRHIEAAQLLWTNAVPDAVA